MLTWRENSRESACFRRTNVPEGFYTLRAIAGTEIACRLATATSQ